MERSLALIPGAHQVVDAHLSADDVAAMIDGGLPADRRADVEAHLALCAVCRSELAAISVLVDSAPTRSTIPIRWIAGAAAAVLVLAVLPLARFVNTTAPTADERSATTNTAAVHTVTPTGEMRVPIESLTFAWHPVPGVTTYKLFVTDSVGAPVYNLKTTDTTVGSIATAHLTPGTRYFWNVDALRSDGSSITSSQLGFSIRPK